MMASDVQFMQSEMASGVMQRVRAYFELRRLEAMKALAVPHLDHREADTLRGQILEAEKFLDIKASDIPTNDVVGQLTGS